MSSIDTVMRQKLHEFVMKPMVTGYTRVGYLGEDYYLDIKLGEGKWIFEIVPKSDYGSLAMKKVFDFHTTEELKKG